MALSPALRLVEARPEPRRGAIFAIASGKGGVGKTWLSITLAHALAERGRRVLLFDGDLGLANVDVQLGLTPAFDLGAVLAGRITLERACVTHPETGLDIVAGLSGAGSLAALPPSRLAALGEELRRLAGGYDATIVDLGGGLDRTVRRLAGIADTCIVVTTEEPTALTDAYAFIKLTAPSRPAGGFRTVVNMVGSPGEGERTFHALGKACRSFLGIRTELAGLIRRDRHVPEAIRRQSPLLTRHPGSDAAEDVRQVAARLLA
jgi:flagellar biosynthesis protein FlhG